MRIMFSFIFVLNTLCGIVQESQLPKAIANMVFPLYGMLIGGRKWRGFDYLIELTELKQCQPKFQYLIVESHQSDTVSI